MYHGYWHGHGARIVCHSAVAVCWKIHCSCWVWNNVIDTGTYILCAGFERVSWLLAQTSESVLVTCTDMIRAGSERVSWLLAETLYVLVLRMSWLLAQTLETMSWLRTQTCYLLVLREFRGYLHRHFMCWFWECRDYWHRHLKQCLGYVYRHGTCWFWESVVVTGTDIVCAGSEIFSWLLVQTFYVLFMKESVG